MGLNPTKFDACNWEKYLFVVVYKHVIEMCMKIMGKYLGKVGWLCLHVQKYCEGVCCCLHVKYIVYKHLKQWCTLCHLIPYVCVVLVYIPIRVLELSYHLFV